ncbi:tyrosine-type recombinase/integrase [Nocardia sp. NPDC052278]|uniref:tyrosine-type recombinase/integrase n=1 Tax=unclassified Nocardia TaxID=2637762 RepID=UPI00367BB884
MPGSIPAPTSYFLKPTSVLQSQTATSGTLSLVRRTASGNFISDHFIRRCSLETTSKARPPSRRKTSNAQDLWIRLTKHANRAALTCPSIATKKVTPHSLRHSAAMALLHAGVDTSVIALWLGHEDPGSTHAYLHADMTLKEKALARIRPPNTSPGRYRAPDTLLAFLDDRRDQSDPILHCLDRSLKPRPRITTRRVEHEPKDQLVQIQ